MLVRTQMSLLTGSFVGAFVWVAGLQFAVEWAVIAFSLNYIPFIGPFIATLFPTLLAMAQFDSWQEVLTLFVCLNIIQFVIGSYIEPRISGNMLSISPSLVLFATLLWTFLWGLFGTFIGVPIAIAVLSFCSQHPSSRWISELLMARRSQKPAELNLLARIRTGYIDALGRKETYQPITACDKRVDMKMCGCIVVRAHHRRWRRYNLQQTAHADPVDMTMSMHHRHTARERFSLRAMQ